MSEEIQPVEDHGIYREESKLEESTFIDPANLDPENNIQSAVVPQGMEWMQQFLINMKSDIQAQVSAQLDSFSATLMQNLPGMIRQEIRDHTRSEPVGDSDAHDWVRSELRVQGDVIRDLARRIESVESSEHQLNAVILAEIRDSQNAQASQIQLLVESNQRTSEESHTNYNSMGHLFQRVRHLEEANARPPAAPDEAPPAVDPRLEELAQRVERQGQQLHLVEKSIERADQDVTRRKGQKEAFGGNNL